MKKYVRLSLILISVVFLSGCTLTGSGGTSEKKVVIPTKGSLLKSTDGGETWKVMWDKNINILAVNVLTIAVNPFDSNNILVGLKEKGILQTSDGGESWSIMKLDAEKIYGLAFNLSDSQTIYATGAIGGRGKVFKTIDSGENWTEIYTSPADGPLAISLFLDKKDPKFIYVSTSDNNVIKSSDAGESWKNIYKAKAPILKIAVDEKTGNIFMIQLGGKVFRSKDKGSTFEDITKKVNDSLWGGSDSNILEIDPSNAGWVYIGGKGGIFRSKNSGETWERLKTLSDPKSYPVRSLAINPKNSNEIIFGAAQVTNRSIDGGINWTTSPLQEPKIVSVLEYNQQDPAIIYLGMSALK